MMWEGEQVRNSKYILGRERDTNMRKGWWMVLTEGEGAREMSQPLHQDPEKAAGGRWHLEMKVLWHKCQRGRWMSKVWVALNCKKRKQFLSIGLCSLQSSKERWEDQNMTSDEMSSCQREGESKMGRVLPWTFIEVGTLYHSASAS